MIEKATCYRVDHDQYLKSTICLVVFGILFVMVTLSAPLNILISGSVTASREDVTPVLTSIVLLPLAFLLLALSMHFLRPRFTVRDVLNLLILLSVPVVYVLSYILIEESRPGFMGIAPWGLIITSSYCTFRFSKIRNKQLSWIFLYTYLFASGLVVLLSYYFLKNNMIEYSASEIFGIDRPQIGGSLLQSTEQSNILACIILFLPIVWTGCKRITDRILVIIVSIPLFSVFAIMGSLGSFFSITCVVLFVLSGSMSLKKSIMILLSVVFVTVLIVTCFESLVTSTTESYYRITDKVTNDRRNSDYDNLWAMITKKPIEGNGIRSVFDKYGVFPHHNILGIWAELGFFLMLTYLVVLFFCFFCIIRIKSLMLLQDQDKVIAKVAACFCMIVLFLHLKGFVHDTWFDLSLWLCSASMFGLAYNPAFCSPSSKMVISKSSI
jgi:O-antigen ligase